MEEILVKLSPIFLFFGLGMVLKKVGFAQTDNADFLLRLVFFVTLPALVLLSLSQTPLTLDKLSLPLINMAVNLSCMGMALFTARLVKIPRKIMGTMMVSAMITNNVFMFPFIMAGFGSSGFADAVLFDFGNGLTTATIAYLVAQKFGSESCHSNTMLLKMIQSPLFWAFGIAIGMSLFSMNLPDFLGRFLESVGGMTSPLILMALGIFFRPRWTQLKLVSLTLFIRVGVGVAVGAGLASLLGLTGQTFAVVMLCSAAPVGFMALTFASIADLDKSFASEVVSASILLGIFYVPILMFFLGA